MRKTDSEWEDMGLYWALRCDANKIPRQPMPPTVKRLQYATINHGSVSMRLAVAVFDDDVPTEVSRDELAWHVKQGGKVSYEPA